jgi:hypothetical protein
MSSALIASTITLALRLVLRALRRAPRMPVTTTSSTWAAPSSGAVWVDAGLGQHGLRGQDAHNQSGGGYALQSAHAKRVHVLFSSQDVRPSLGAEQNLAVFRPGY